MAIHKTARFQVKPAAVEKCKQIHSASPGVQRFTAVLYPELADGKVTFTDYTLLATTER